MMMANVWFLVIIGGIISSVLTNILIRQSYII